VDPENQHVWKTVRIGRIRGDGQFDVQWTSGFPIQPVPYPPHRTPEQWQRLLDDMYAEWGQKWMRPAN
jgi:urea transport system substrate-binding protein